MTNVDNVRLNGGQKPQSGLKSRPTHSRLRVQDRPSRRE